MELTQNNLQAQIFLINDKILIFILSSMSLYPNVDKGS